MTQTKQNDVASIVDAIMENAKCFPEFNPEIRQVTTREPVRQGDVYFLPFDISTMGLHNMEGDNIFELTEIKQGQGLRLVPKSPGETKGSNHILVKNKEIHVFYPKGTSNTSYNPNSLWGPILHIPKGQSALVVHPEHAGLNFTGEACGIWKVAYQEDTIRQQRTAD